MPATRIAPLIAAAALAFTAVASAQTLYRWVDKDGKVQYSDMPPSEAVKGLTQKDVRVGDTDESPLPYAAQVAMKRHPVKLYVGTDCEEGCEIGRKLLAGRGIPYSEFDVQVSKEAADALKKLIDAPFIPTLTVGEVTLKGYAEDAWNAALDAAGYPRTRLPGRAAPKPVKSPGEPAPSAEPATGR